MRISELEQLLNEIGIPEHEYSIQGGLPNEVFCIEESGNIWTTYYSERGLKTGLKEFNNESEACEYFYAWIKRIFNK